ncbi:general substrate transporter [Aaosphaeria arxii CBS 175.79]|uniref:General substrate transporter n=1 Tax=Aaosphaeria arxii CBS 175.79 TaxID=1450172 RepID=A0A6A5XZ44_9PLEO|nr:general substrate transporter [Aaosphaeria arxii CBS 175.79]KAF2018163.1 general substrate transporter [Aaosphaeria arxii CBS 175.79]
MTSRQEKTEIVETNEHVPVDLNSDSAAQLGHLANAEDHETGKLASFKKYPWACLWSLYAVWLVLLVSFENQAAGVVISIPEFRKDFGHPLPDGSGYVIEANWQSAFQGAPVASAIVGALGCGQLADWIGRRMVVLGCLVVSFAAITMEFVSTSNELFFGGKFLNGFATGALASLTVTYIGEIAPLALRGLLTCLSALAYTFGPLTVALIINSIGTYPNRWAYRSVFCAQYGFAAIAALIWPFMPESPWWLASKERHDDALKALNKLGHKGAEGQKKLALINVTLQEVRKETEDTTYLECFRKSNLRRTIISIAPLSIQALSGIAFAASYSTYYMQLAGFSTEMSFKLQIVQQVISLLGNVMSWYLVDRVGRRNLTFYGLLILTVILFLMAGLATLETVGGNKGAVSMILLYCWWYNVTIGATAYTILCEVSTSRLRVKTISIGIACQSMLNMMWSFVLPYLFNPDKLNLGGRLGFIFGGLAVICLVYLWFYQPETAGRSFEELDEMFIKRVPARKFKGYRTDAQAMGEAVKEKEGTF